MASRKKILLKVRIRIHIPVASILYGVVRVLTVLQVIILGDSGVGKTSLMNQYVRHSFIRRDYRAYKHLC